jgi:mRNA-degrading endonuclease RelE of RelBE toxin-antitoxin system
VKTKIRLETQVEAFVKSLAPEPRRRLRLAIQGLAEGSGPIKSLEGKLVGYSRLSVAGYRVIFKERSEAGNRVVDCIFAERRALVYEIFTQLLVEQTMS